jgi:hypothetical protein
VFNKSCCYNECKTYPTTGNTAPFKVKSVPYVETNAEVVNGTARLDTAKVRETTVAARSLMYASGSDVWRSIYVR